MDNQQIKTLITLTDVVLSDLRYYEQAIIRDHKSPYVPSYLRKPKETEKRERVQRTLEAFRDIIKTKYITDDDTIKDEAVICVFIALLYIALADRNVNYHEYKAYMKLAAADCKSEAKKIYEEAASLISGLMPEVNEQNFNERNFELIRKLVLNHKRADRVTHYRLPKHTYDMIQEAVGNGGIMGIMAAACYNTSGELSSDHSKTIETIIEAWKKQDYDQKNFPASYQYLKFDVLWDYPLCDINPKNYSRLTLDKKKCEHFCDFLICNNFKENDSKEKIYTFNYIQSRLLSSIYDAFLGGGYYFLRCNYEIPEDTEIKVSEIRLKEKIALPLLLGKLDIKEKYETEYDVEDLVSSISENSQLPCDWLKLITEFAKGNNFYEEYCPIPLTNYFPLPLLVNYFKHAKTYHEKELCKITYEFVGPLDHYFKKYFAILIPDIVSTKKHDESLRLTIEKLLSSYATNIGVCAGYDRIQLKVKEEEKVGDAWLIRIKELLSDKYSGYELLIRYIETYMRSHDVQEGDLTELDQFEYWNKFRQIEETLSKRENNGNYDIGMDIGATAIKYKLYRITESDKFEEVRDNKNRVIEYRSSIKKDSKDDLIKYSGLEDFSDKIIKDIKNLLAVRGGLTFNDVGLVGICWPGAVREQKIAGASGIMKNFDKKIASNFIRENTIDQIRSLDLIGALKKKISKEVKPGKEVNIGLTNDGYAEALGRMKEDGDKLFLREDNESYNKIKHLKPKWTILKLGTGTAGAVFTHDRIYEGPTEFGKLVLNVFNNRGHNLGNQDKTPDGLLNEYASDKLLPTVYRHVSKVDFDVSSYEIGRIAEFLEPTDKDVDKLIFDIGMEFVHSKYLSSIMPKPGIERKPGGNYSVNFPGVKKGIILDALHIPDEEDLEKYIVRKGKERLAGVFEWKECRYEFIKGEINKIDKTDKIKKNFNETFTRAGSLLADAIMLIYEYYSIHGVVLCGGVFQKTSGKKMLESIKTHLKKKYFVDFGGIDEYQEDVKQSDALGKKHLTTIYYLVNSSVEEKSSSKENIIIDRGSLGALYHALISKI
jgi:hypothetical protein